MAPPIIKKRILVTGGCGYIGSHTLVCLLDPTSSQNKTSNIEYSLVVVDDLSNSSPKSLQRVASILQDSIPSLKQFQLSKDGTWGEDPQRRLIFRKVDCCDEIKFRQVFQEFAPPIDGIENGFDAVIHFAGLKAVGDSKKFPLNYYRVNIDATLTLLKLMEEFGCRTIVFSSSATVYGVVNEEVAREQLRASRMIRESQSIGKKNHNNSSSSNGGKGGDDGGGGVDAELSKMKGVGLKETDEVGVTITNCYGRTKYTIELILKDLYESQSLIRANDDGKNENNDDGTTTTCWSITILRYFNPAGAHPSGHMGEDPHGVPNNLMPFVSQVAVGRRERVTVLGNDFDTWDGTGVRDYLHVMDLGEGHVAALRYMDRREKSSDEEDGGGSAGSAGGSDTHSTHSKCGYGKLSIFNLGTGTGYSVLDMIHAMSKACKKEIPYVVGPRREGDVTIYMADPSKAKVEMGWEAKKDLDDMCNDLWRWQTLNPNGYGDNNDGDDLGDES